MEPPPNGVSHTLAVPGRERPAPAADASSSHQLPTDLSDRATERLGLMAAILAAIIFIEGVVSHVSEYAMAPAYPDRYQLIDAIGVLVFSSISMAAWALLRSRRWSVQTRLRFGEGYLVAAAYFISLLDHADHFWRDGHNLHGMPGVIILLLVFPVIVPMRPLRALVLALVMAATGPLALFTLSWGLDYQRPHIGALLASFPFLAAPLAAALARIVHALGVELKHARRLGQYELERQIGEGGMGVVYEAQHAMMRRPTAIKLLPADKAGAASLARFEREVQLTAELTHPHTITIYDYGRTADGVFYYAMELLDGATLGAVVKRAGPLPPARAIRILYQVAGALSEAHAVGLIHRDIKPANIMLVEQGGIVDQAKVLDFGLVKEIDTADEEALTRGDSVLGTPEYLAPEAIKDPSNVDERVDIYALGAVGYYMLTGEHVFAGNSIIEVCARHLHDAPLPPTERLGAPLPAALEELVLNCLAKDPDDRPQSMAAVRRALEALDDFGAWTDSCAATWWADDGVGLSNGPSTRPPRSVRKHDSRDDAA